MAVLANLLRTYVTSTGTGTLALGGAVPGFLTPAQAGLANGAMVSYAIIDGVQTEVGRGVYNSTLQTITRSVLYSTSNNALINVTATAEFVVTFLNEDKTDLEAAIAARILNAANQVLNSNLNVVNSQTLKGRATSGVGNVEDLTPAQARSVIGMSQTLSQGNWYRYVTGNVIILTGTLVATTNANGEVTLSYPVAFPVTGVHSIWQNGDPATSGQAAVISQPSGNLGSATSVNLRLWNPATGAVANTPFRAVYIAIGQVS